MLPLIVAIVITVADQLTKELVRGRFIAGETLPIFSGFFSLTHVRNTGAAWGILGGQNTSLTILSVVMLAVMVIFRRSFLSDTGSTVSRSASCSAAFWGTCWIACASGG